MGIFFRINIIYNRKYSDFLIQTDTSYKNRFSRKVPLSERPKTPGPRK